MRLALLLALVPACASTPPPAAPAPETTTEAPPATASAGSSGEATPSPYPPGLAVTDTKLGTGAVCKKGDRITVRYVGTLDDGSKFDESASATFQIGVGMLIKGWDEGIPGMRVGGVRQLVVPPQLGYGGKNMGKIPPYSTLHFEVELLAIEP